MSLIQDTKEDEEENGIYFNFINSIKSDVTKEIYEYNIKKFMEFCNVQTFNDLFAVPNPNNCSNNRVRVLTTLLPRSLVLMLFFLLVLAFVLCFVTLL